MKSNRDFIEGIYQKARAYPCTEINKIKKSLPEVVRNNYILSSDFNNKSDLIFLYCLSDLRGDHIGNLSGFHTFIILIIHRL